MYFDVGEDQESGGGNFKYNYDISIDEKRNEDDDVGVVTINQDI